MLLWIHLFQDSLHPCLCCIILITGWVHKSPELKVIPLQIDAVEESRLADQDVFASTSVLLCLWENGAMSSSTREEPTPTGLWCRQQFSLSSKAQKVIYPNAVIVRSMRECVWSAAVSVHTDAADRFPSTFILLFSVDAAVTENWALLLYCRPWSCTKSKVSLFSTSAHKPVGLLPSGSLCRRKWLF